jgi:hypothetical protein
MPRLPHSPRHVGKIPVSSPEKNLAPGCAWGGSEILESQCLALFYVLLVYVLLFLCATYYLALFVLCTTNMYY